MTVWRRLAERLRDAAGPRSRSDAEPPRFDRVLREAVEREGGLVLGLASFERMISDRAEQPGAAESSPREIILRRSRKILASIARFVRAQEERA